MAGLVVGAAGLVAALLSGSVATAAGTAPSVPSSFTAVNPVRLLDTRPSQPIGANTFRKVQVTGATVPAGATAAVLNVTATGSTAGGFFTVFPDGTTRPTASAVNFAKNQTIANQLVVPLGTDGAVDIYNLAGTTQAVVDVYGYYAATPAPTTDVVTLTSLNNGTTTLTHVGGAIASPGFATPLTSEATIPAGTWQYSFYADGHRQGPGTDNPVGNETRLTDFLWADLDNDTAYNWQTGEALGDTVQTGPIALTPTGSIEASATGTGIITLTKPTTVQLGGFGYNSNTGSYGTAGQPGAGAFQFLGAHATFVRINPAG
jgi:hypothetical protein